MSNPDLPSHSTLYEAGQRPDRSGFTVAGRAFQKHASRNPEKWGIPIGNPNALNQSGLAHLEEIISSSDTIWNIRHHSRFGRILEGKISDGRGVRWSANGERLIGFLD